MPETAPAAAEPAPAPARRKPAVIVESLGKTAMARVRAEHFAEALPQLREEVLPLTGQNVVLSMRGIESITEHDAGELSSLAAELGKSGRTLRLSNPEPAVVAVLDAAGLNGLLSGTATRASS